MIIYQIDTCVNGISTWYFKKEAILRLLGEGGSEE
jgi:hypothetical protein